ncbi:MAG: dihydropteroate synthase [Candidatus Methanomethylophilaceae archaeon]
MRPFEIGGRRFDTPVIMGVLNVTPDSFSDGGLHTDPRSAVGFALEMEDLGASIIDVGAESTRPGFTPVSAEEELSRLLPVIRGIRDSSDVLISVDTMKAEVAEAAVSAGADIINDVNAFRGEGMLECLADTGAYAVIMHCPGDIRTVHQHDMSGDVIPQIAAYLRERTEAALDMGVDRKDIMLDPGVGFGKTMEQNESIIMRLDELEMGYPILMALSRKRVLARMYPGMDRDEATVLATMEAVRRGASAVRVHDVGMMASAVRGYNGRL